MATISNPRNGNVVIRIGRSSFTLETDGTDQAVSATMMEYILKIKRAGGDFDYVIGYPRSGDPVCACRKGLRPEHFPELLA